MKPGSKFFTPPLSSRDRELFLRCLGLDALKVFFLETTGHCILRSLEVTGASLMPRLDPMTLDTSLASLSPLLWLKDPPSHLKLQPAQPTCSLWEELFPYPFSLFPLAFHRDTNDSLEIRPVDLKEALSYLMSALLQLESHLSATELGFLWMRRSGVELPLLFHFVRGKRVRLGVAPHLAELGTDPVTLKASLGTQVSLLRLDWEEDAQPGLSSASTSIRKAASTLQKLLDSCGKTSTGGSPRHSMTDELQL